MNIYLFDSQDTRNNRLKDFLYYLKYMGHRGVINFSYSNEADSLHTSMTIKENLILDAVPTSLIKENEVNLNDFLQDIKNPDLIQLLGQIDELSQVISDLDKRKMKITSLVKALISQRELIFLVNPHHNLDGEDIKLLKKCLYFEAIENKRRIYIQSDDQSCWLDTAHVMISRTKNYRFEESENPFLIQPTRESLKLVA